MGLKLTAVAFAAAISLGQTALAGVYTDDLTKCVVKSTSPADQQLLVQWIFATLALHPAVQPLSSISDTQRDDFDKRTVGLFARLLSDDCSKETEAALKADGPVAIQQSFQVLGQVATRGLMSDPAVSRSLQGLEKYMEQEPRLIAILKPSGVPTETPRPAPAQ